MIRSRIGVMVAATVVLGALAVTAPANSAIGTVLNTPGGRAGMGMAYDAAHGQVVMFGGVINGGWLNDTWTWNGTHWTPHTAAHRPFARMQMGMAYDAAHGQVVLFGGVGPGFLGDDTWTWDG